MEPIHFSIIPQNERNTLLAKALQEGFMDSARLLIRGGGQLNAVPRLAAIAAGQTDIHKALQFLEFLSENIGPSFLLEQDNVIGDKDQTAVAVAAGTNKEWEVLCWLQQHGFKDSMLIGLDRRFQSEENALRFISLFPLPAFTPETSQRLQGVAQKRFSEACNNKFFQVIERFLSLGWPIPRDSIENAIEKGDHKHARFLLSHNKDNSILSSIFSSVFDTRWKTPKSPVRGGVVLMQFGLQEKDLDSRKKLDQKIMKAWPIFERRELEKSVKRMKAERDLRFRAQPVRKRI